MQDEVEYFHRELASQTQVMDSFLRLEGSQPQNCYSMQRYEWACSQAVSKLLNF